MYFQFLFPDEYSYILKQPNMLKNLKYFWIKNENESRTLILATHLLPTLDKKHTWD